MYPMVIRATMKFIYLGYLLVIVILVVSIVALMRIEWPPSIPSTLGFWIFWLPFLLLLWPSKRHLQRRESANPSPL